MSCRILNQYRGARFVLPLVLKRTGEDWDDTRVRVELKEDIDGPVVTAFDTAPGGGSTGTSATASQTDVGRYNVELIAEAHVTAAWPDGLIGDVWVYRSSPIFGPYIVASFSVVVKQPATVLLP